MSILVHRQLLTDFTPTRPFFHRRSNCDCAQAVLAAPSKWTVAPIVSTWPGADNKVRVVSLPSIQLISFEGLESRRPGMF